MSANRPPIDPSRRDFLHVGGRRATRRLRPPWAVDETRFIERCTRCDECVRHCPERVLRRGSGGFPEMDFSRAGCTFCGECLEVCKPRALALSAHPPVNWQAVIGDDCLARRGVTCRACGDTCEAGVIRFRPLPGGRAVVELAGDLCNGCGACVRFCPVGAIRVNPGVQSGEAA